MKESVKDPDQTSQDRSQNPVSRSALDQLCGLSKDGSAHMVCRVITLYLARGRDNVRVMKEAVACGDHAAAGRAAHTLVSSSGMVGAMTLSALCAEMENRCRSSAGEDVRDLCSRILEEHGAVTEALVAELGRLSSKETFF